jgi:hypothetical protein
MTTRDAFSSDEEEEAPQALDPKDIEDIHLPSK